MPFWTAGRRRKRATALALDENASPAGPPLTVVRVATASLGESRSFGRRDVGFEFDRVFVPSLIIDHTELVLRQAGIRGYEGFAVWAGTLSGGDAHIATLVVPQSNAGPTHGEISADTTARVLSALDHRDLVPVLQLHTHPRAAFLSDTDATRPIVAVPGFMSIVVPNLGFVNLGDVTLWSAHEFTSPTRWRELDVNERQRRFIIDDSVIQVD